MNLHPIVVLWSLLGACAGGGPAPLVQDFDRDGFSAAEGDCDDGDAAISPSAADRVGDGVDQNCDGVDGSDGDGDGFASVASGGEDCDDADAARNPGVVDRVGDGIDQNCDAADGVDADRDGVADEASGGFDCDDTDPQTFPGHEDEAGDDVDRDCDGVDGVDADRDGYASVESGGDDCADGDPAFSPAAADEVGDAVDQNCDGLDGVDGDGDGVASLTSLGVDCDDAEPTVHPGAREICDGLDNDCDGDTFPRPNVRLEHLGVVSFANSVAEAVEAAVDGDVVGICGDVDGSGLRITTSITLRGLEDPDLPTLRCGRDLTNGAVATPRTNCAVDGGDVVFDRLWLRGGGGREVQGAWVGGVLDVGPAVRSVTITGSRVSRGEADLGGVIAVTGGAPALTIVDSLVTDGYAEHGGALLLSSDGPTSIVRSVVSGSAAAYGGGIDLQRGPLTIEASTVNNHRARCGAGILLIVRPTTQLTMTGGAVIANYLEAPAIDGCAGGLNTSVGEGGQTGDTTVTLSGVNFGPPGLLQNDPTDLCEADVGCRSNLGLNVTLTCTPGDGGCL